ncbi:MAG: hypothetical protein H7210_03935 [Pyrinomonadaceae bacterium]|nr:hypothetical protein [Phycisphaerales bacterium]
MRAGFIAATLAAIVGWCAPRALASPPTALYLIPDSYHTRVGSTLQLSLKRGLGSGEPIEHSVAFESLTSDWFFFRVAATQENRDSPLLMNEAAKPGNPVPPAPDQPQPAPAKLPAPANPSTSPDNNKTASPPPASPLPIPKSQLPVSFRLNTPGVAMAGCDFSPRVERVPAAELLAFLKASLTPQAYDDVVPSLPAQGDVRVRRIETVKTMLRIAADDPAAVPDTQTASSKIGQVNEVRFTFDPTVTPIGSDAVFRLFANYDKAANARVTVACDQARFSQQIQSDGSGTARFTIAHEGMWRIEFHHVKALQNDPDVDVVLSSATVTFHTIQKEAAR